MKKIMAIAILAFLLVVACTPLHPPVSPLAPPGAPLPAAPAALPQLELSGPAIAAIVAALTSLALAYIPGLAPWWATFTDKRVALAGAGFLVTVLLVALHYVGAINLGLGVFDWGVFWQAVTAWLAFSGAGQLAFTAQKALPAV